MEPHTASDSKEYGSYRTHDDVAHGNSSSVHVTRQLAHEVHRLSSVVNELTLQCVLNGVQLPNFEEHSRLDAPAHLDARILSAFPWAELTSDKPGTKEWEQVLHTLGTTEGQSQPIPLQSLKLSSSSASDVNIGRVLSNCRLRSLATDCRPQCLKDVLHNLNALSSLTYLELRNTVVPYASALELTELQQLHNLSITNTILPSSARPSVNSVTPALPSGASFQQLVALDVSGSLWHPLDLSDLAARSPCLLALSLAGTQSNDNMISTLPAACSQLQILDISWCRNITCASITNLSALSNLTALKVPPELHVQAIGKLLPAQSSLRVLHASNNKAGTNSASTGDAAPDRMSEVKPEPAPKAVTDEPSLTACESSDLDIAADNCEIAAALPDEIEEVESSTQATQEHSVAKQSAVLENVHEHASALEGCDFDHKKRVTQVRLPAPVRKFASVFLSKSSSLPNSISPQAIPSMPPVPIAAIKAMNGVTPGRRLQASCDPAHVKSSPQSCKTIVNAPSSNSGQTASQAIPGKGAVAPPATQSTSTAAQEFSTNSVSGKSSSSEALLMPHELQLAKICTTSNDDRCIKIPHRFAHKSPSTPPSPSPACPKGGQVSVFSHNRPQYPVWSPGDTRMAHGALQPSNATDLTSKRHITPTSPLLAASTPSKRPTWAWNISQSSPNNIEAQHAATLPQLKASRNAAWKLAEWGKHAHNSNSKIVEGQAGSRTMALRTVGNCSMDGQNGSSGVLVTHLVQCTSEKKARSLATGNPFTQQRCIRFG